MQNRLTVDKSRAKKTIILHHSLKIETLNQKFREVINSPYTNWEYAVSIAADIYDSAEILGNEVYDKYEEEM